MAMNSFSDDIQQWLLHAISADAKYSTVKTGTRTSECATAAFDGLCQELA